MAAESTYEFGPYRLEVSTRRLLRGDELVPLTPKAFATLVALIERRDRVVDKADLMKVVWPDSFVEEANLSQTIFVLRKTLGEDADGRQFIDTIPRRGYRFAADVREVIDEPPSLANPTRRIPLTGWLAASIVIAIAATGLWLAARDRATPDDPPPGTIRVVVLPFENLTRDPQDDWLAGAFSDSLGFALQGLPDVICVTRDRVVELYREASLEEGAAIDAEALRRIAGSLGVTYYVHGSYQRIGGRLRVIARVVENATGVVRAQEIATDDVTNLLALEDHLSNQLAAKVGPRTSTAAGRAPSTSSLDAYRSVVEGRTAYAAGARLKEALAHFERAVSLDARYAEAWAMRAKTKARLAAPATYSGGGSSVRDLREGALVDAQRAVELNSELYDARAALALAYRETEQAGPWRAEAEKAVALNPRLPEAFALLGDWYAAMPAFGCTRGFDAAQTETHYRNALRLDPRLSVGWGNLVFHLIWAGRANEGITVADEALRVMPGNTSLLRGRAMALLFAGQVAEAKAALRLLVYPGRDQNLLNRWLDASIALFEGDAARASSEFAAIGSAMSDTSYEFRFAWSYFLANRTADAIRHLDRAINRNPACVRFVVTSPAFAPYRETPQFRARLEAWKKAGG